MTISPSEYPTSEAAILRERLSRLSAASLRINESLDFDTVLQEVVDAARSLAGARYGALTVSGEAGQVPHFIVSGLTVTEHRIFWDLPEGRRFFEYLSMVSEPLRVPDIALHLRALDLPEFLPPVPLHALLVAPVRHQGQGVGVIYLAHGEPGREFSVEDEETLVMFASQAALVIANARRHRDERRARAGLETLVNTSPVSVVVFDVRTGVPVSFNREARRLADALRNPDQSPEELLDTLTIRRADGREETLAKLPLVQMMSAGDTVRAEEITLIAPDGRSVTALLNATPIRAGDGETDDGAVESYVVTLQDLTELEELGRLRAEFLGMVSQQLRTPLAAVRGAVSTLLENGAELEPAETRQFHRIIRDQSDRMRRLIGDLLDVARIETGTLAVAPAPVEVGELVEDAKQRFLSRGGRRGLEIEIDLEPNLPPALADGWRMAQALGHLLYHVAAGLPLGSPMIKVSAGREGLYVAISVAGLGSDDASEELPRRLGRFPQVDGDDHGGDAGLGLAICRGIVEAHGGRLRVEYDGPDGGAVFTLTLPAAEWETGVGAADPTMTAAETVRSRGAAQERLRVLAIDDDPQALRYLRDALWNAGHFPISTGDPEDIPRLIREEQPHLVLLDATLTGHDGLSAELVLGILEAANAPVILVTASGQEEVMAHALDLGVSDYLVKPFSPSELAARIRTALRRHDDPHMAASSRPYVLGDLTIDYAGRRVSLAGSAVTLTPNEYGLLAELAVNAGQTVAYDQLLQRVWSPGRRGQRWLLREVVKRIRGKLGDDADNPAYVFTVPRAGYRLGPAQDA